MNEQKQIAIGAITIVAGTAVIWLAAKVWAHRKVIRRRMAQAKRLPLPPGTATPRGQQATDFLRTITEAQKSRILDALSFFQKLSLAALDEDNPLEVYDFWARLDPKQRDVIRDTLNQEQMASLQSVLRAGKEAKDGKAQRQ